MGESSCLESPQHPLQTKTTLTPKLSLKSSQTRQKQQKVSTSLFWGEESPILIQHEWSVNLMGLLRSRETQQIKTQVMFQKMTTGLAQKTSMPSSRILDATRSIIGYNKISEWVWQLSMGSKSQIISLKLFKRNNSMIYDELWPHTPKYTKF